MLRHTGDATVEQRLTLHSATYHPQMALREDRLDQVVQFECLILLPADKNTTFKRAGVIWFRERLDEQGEPHSEDHDQWLHARAALHRQLHTPNVPTHLYEDVDQDMMYTLTLV